MKDEPGKARQRLPGWTGCIAWAAGGLLQVQACARLDPSEAGSAAVAGQGQTGGAVGSIARGPAPSASVEVAPQRTRRGQMLSHYADTSAMREAVVAGRLADYRVAAAAVARDEWAPSATADEHRFTRLVRAAATEAQSTTSLVAAAAALGAIGDLCASCHVASGAPQIPIAPEQPSEASSPRMLDHAVASDLLWAGLTLPSDESWSSGMRLLLQAPGIAQPSAEVSAAVHQLGELARRGERVEPGERSRVFADVVLTCSGCHERLGVVPQDGVVVR